MALERFHIIEAAFQKALNNVNGAPYDTYVPGTCDIIYAGGYLHHNVLSVRRKWVLFGPVRLSGSPSVVAIAEKLLAKGCTITCTREIADTPDIITSYDPCWRVTYPAG